MDILAAASQNPKLEMKKTLAPQIIGWYKADEVPQKQRVKPTKLPMTIGKLKVTIKINKLPASVQTNKDNWKIFHLDCDDRVVEVSVKPRGWKKLEDGGTNYFMWIG